MCGWGNSVLQTHFVVFSLMIDIGLSFKQHYPHPLSWPTGEGHRLGNFMFKFYV